MHHAHVCQAAGDSIRLSQALAGKGMIPLSPLLRAQVRALPWRQVPAGSVTRDTGHGRAETRTLKATNVSRLDFPHAHQAIKITRWRQDITAGRASREAVYAVTSLTSAEATHRTWPASSATNGPSRRTIMSVLREFPGLLRDVA